MGCCASICKKDDNSNNKPSSEKHDIYNNSSIINKPSSEKQHIYNNSSIINKPSSEKLPVYDVFLHDSYSSRPRDKSCEITEISKSYYKSPIPETMSYVCILSTKHKEFIREPMRDKDVRCIAGIGEKYGNILESKGFCKAYHVLGQYLLLSRDISLFEQWLEAGVGMNNSKWRGDCSACLEEWCEINL